MVLPLFVMAASAFSAKAHKHEPDSAAHAKRLAELKAWFEPGAIVSGPTLVDCTLSGGTSTKCFSITVKPEPAGYKAGPWCPRTISDGPDTSGIWLDKGKVHAADGPFVANLKTFYKDDTWQLFDPKTGKVRVTTTKESCQGAARPDVDPKYQNHCVECETSYMASGAVNSYVIPIEPVAASGTPTKGRGPVGLSFNGPRFDGPAPVHAILAAHTLAPFDKCGGHVNLHDGYHIHAVTDCVKKVAVKGDQHADVIGVAMDGFPMTARLDSAGKEPEGLDTCRGHTTSGLGYHYHVASPGTNAILTCFKGETGCAFEGGSQSCNATKWGRIRRTIWRWIGWE